MRCKISITTKIFFEKLELMLQFSRKPSFFCFLADPMALSEAAYL
jgi:hypothetical protein